MSFLIRGIKMNGRSDALMEYYMNTFEPQQIVSMAIADKEGFTLLFSYWKETFEFYEDVELQNITWEEYWRICKNIWDFDIFTRIVNMTLNIEPFINTDSYSYLQSNAYELYEKLERILNETPLKTQEEWNSFFDKIYDIIIEYFAKVVDWRLAHTIYKTELLKRAYEQAVTELINLTHVIVKEVTDVEKDS